MGVQFSLGKEEGTSRQSEWQRGWAEHVGGVCESRSVRLDCGVHACCEDLKTGLEREPMERAK